MSITKAGAVILGTLNPVEKGPEAHQISHTPAQEIVVLQDEIARGALAAEIAIPNGFTGEEVRVADKDGNPVLVQASLSMQDRSKSPLTTPVPRSKGEARLQRNQEIMGDIDQRNIDEMLSLLPKQYAGDILERFDSIPKPEKALVAAIYWGTDSVDMNMVSPELVKLCQDLRVPPLLREAVVMELESNGSSTRRIKGISQMLDTIAHKGNIELLGLETIVKRAPNNSRHLPIVADLLRVKRERDEAIVSRDEAIASRNVAILSEEIATQNFDKTAERLALLIEAHDSLKKVIDAQ